MACREIICFTRSTTKCLNTKHNQLPRRMVRILTAIEVFYDLRRRVPLPETTTRHYAGNTPIQPSINPSIKSHRQLPCAYELTKSWKDHPLLYSSTRDSKWNPQLRSVPTARSSKLMYWSKDSERKVQHVQRASLCKTRTKKIRHSSSLGLVSSW